MPGIIWRSLAPRRDEVVVATGFPNYPSGAPCVSESADADPRADVVTPAVAWQDFASECAARSTGSGH